MKFKINLLLKDFLVTWVFFFAYEYLFVGIFSVLRLKKGIFINGYGKGNFNNTYYCVAKDPFQNISSYDPISDFFLNLIPLIIKGINIFIPIILGFILFKILVVRNWNQRSFLKKMLFLLIWITNILLGVIFYSAIQFDYIISTGIDSI